MAVNNFLIIGTTPSNNEESISPKANIIIKFSKYMKEESLTSIVLLDEESNEVEVHREYNGETMELTLSPSLLLENKIYKILAKGTSKGILSINNDYLGSDKEYVFTTGLNDFLDTPKELNVKVLNGFISLDWKAVLSSNPVSYSVSISTVNEEVEDFLTTTIIENRIFFKDSLTVEELEIEDYFEEGNYYLYIQAFTEDTKSNILKKEIIIANKSTEEDLSNNDEEVDPFDTFDIVSTFPENKSSNQSLDYAMFAFNHNVDVDSFNKENIYILEAKGKESLSKMDLLTKYKQENQIESEILFDQEDKTMILIKAEFEKDKEYVIVLRKELSSEEGLKLDVDYSISFKSEYEYLFGDLSLIKSDLSVFGKNLEDDLILKYMNQNSIYAYEIVTASNSEITFTDGKAPFYVHQYVRYKTDFDLVLAMIVSESTDSNKSITLGDLSVSKSDTVSNLYKLLDYFKDQIKRFEDELNGESLRGKAKPSMVVRGVNSDDGDYPDFMDREEFRELGG